MGILVRVIAFFSIVFLICFSSCNESKVENVGVFPMSDSQRRLEALVDSFVYDVEHANEQSVRENIRDSYNARMLEFLSVHYLDSIRVQVDSVVIDSVSVTANLNCSNKISFKSILRFQKNKNLMQDSLMGFIVGLKPGYDTLLNLNYLGNHQFYLPYDGKASTVKIFAFPMPIWSPTPN